MKKIYGTRLWQYLIIISGLMLCGLAYRMFLVPCNIAPGGFTGIGQLINSLTGGRVSVGIVPIILNVPLFALTLKRLGLKTGILSLIATFALSFLIDYLPVPAATDDMLLATIFGGVMGGVGFGLILRGGATTGGTDMLGKLVNHRFRFVKVSHVTLVCDAAVILASAFVFDTHSAMYALISVVLMNYLLDLTLEGPDLARAYFVISDKSGEIAQAIMAELERGVTTLNGKGVYTGAEKDVILCVVGRLESLRLRQLILSIDKRAFIIATNVHEALGEGFKEY